jgi:hypothetical protein
MINAYHHNAIISSGFYFCAVQGAATDRHKTKTKLFDAFALISHPPSPQIIIW